MRGWRMKKPPGLPGGSRFTLPRGRSVAGAGQATLFQQRFDLRILAGEIAEQLHRVDAAALGQQRGAEVVAVLAAEAAVPAE
ncbi:hypothetical protein G6F65_022141 [Rhizopus arrhizus]|nr:hypothetical protein G6F65_022141 [Rhizopus arrhizus]